MPRKKKKLGSLSTHDIAAIRHVARNALGQAGISAGDIDDVMQELAIHLCRCYHTFNCRKGKWATFRGIILERALAKVIRGRGQKSSIPLSPEYSVSLNVDIASEQDDSIPWIECVNADGLIADGTDKPEITGLDLKIDVTIFMESIPEHLKKSLPCVAKNAAE